MDSVKYIFCLSFRLINYSRSFLSPVMYVHFIEKAEGGKVVVIVFYSL